MTHWQCCSIILLQEHCDFATFTINPLQEYFTLLQISAAHYIALQLLYAVSFHFMILIPTLWYLATWMAMTHFTSVYCSLWCDTFSCEDRCTLTPVYVCDTFFVIFLLPPILFVVPWLNIWICKIFVSIPLFIGKLGL